MRDELKKIKKDNPTPDKPKTALEWLKQRLPEELACEEEIVMAIYELQKASKDPVVLEALEIRKRQQHEEASRLYQAKMEVKEEIAKNAYKEGQSLEFISNITELPIEKLKQILK